MITVCPSKIGWMTMVFTVLLALTRTPKSRRSCVVSSQVQTLVTGAADIAVSLVQLVFRAPSSIWCCLRIGRIFCRIPLERKLGLEHDQWVQLNQPSFGRSYEWSTCRRLRRKIVRRSKLVGLRCPTSKLSQQAIIKVKLISFFVYGLGVEVFVLSLWRVVILVSHLFCFQRVARVPRGTEHAIEE